MIVIWVKSRVSFNYFCLKITKKVVSLISTLDEKVILLVKVDYSIKVKIWIIWLSKVSIDVFWVWPKVWWKVQVREKIVDESMMKNEQLKSQKVSNSKRPTKREV